MSDFPILFLTIIQIIFTIDATGPHLKNFLLTSNQSNILVKKDTKTPVGDNLMPVDASDDLQYYYDDQESIITESSKGSNILTATTALSLEESSFSTTTPVFDNATANITAVTDGRIDSIHTNRPDKNKHLLTLTRRICRCSDCEICVDKVCVGHVMKYIFTPDCMLVDMCVDHDCNGFPCESWLGIAVCLCENGTYGEHCAEKAGEFLTISNVRVLYPPSVAAGQPVEIIMFWRDRSMTAQSSQVSFYTDGRSYQDIRKFSGPQNIRRVDWNFTHGLSDVYCSTFENYMLRFQHLCKEFSKMTHSSHVQMSFKTEFPFKDTPHESGDEDEDEVNFQRVKVVGTSPNKTVLGYYLKFEMRMSNKEQNFDYRSDHWIFVYYNNTKVYLNRDFPQKISPMLPCVKYSDIEGGSREGVAFRKDPIVLSAFIHQQILSESADSSKVQFKYIVSKDEDDLHISSTEMTYEGKEYRIRPFELDEGLYRVKIGVSVQTDNETVAHNFVLCWFRVEQLGLIAGIVGGRMRTVYSLDDLVLDASPSHNPNIESHLQQGLFFDWSCNATDMYFCRKHTTKAREYVIKGPLQSGVSILFYLTVYAFNYGNATDEQIIITTNLSFSSYSVQCEKNCDPINPDKSVYLSASTTNTDFTDDFDWTYQVGSNDTKEHPMTKDNNKLIEQGSYSIIINSSFLDEGLNYTFLATRRNPYGQASISLVSGNRPDFTCETQIEKNRKKARLLKDKVTVLCKSRNKDTWYSFYTQFDENNPLEKILSKGRFYQRRPKATPIFLGTSEEWSGRLIDGRLFIRAMSKSGCFKTVFNEIQVEWPSANQFEDLFQSWDDRAIEAETRKELSLYEEGKYNESSYNGILNWLCYAHLVRLNLHENKAIGNESNFGSSTYQSWELMHKLFKERIDNVKGSGGGYYNIFLYKQTVSDLVHIMMATKVNGASPLRSQTTLIRDAIAELVLSLTEIYENKGGEYFHDDVKLTTAESLQLSESLLICLTNVMQSNKKQRNVTPSRRKNDTAHLQEVKFQSRHGQWEKTEVIDNRFSVLSEPPIKHVDDNTHLIDLKMNKKLTHTLEKALLSLMQGFTRRLKPMEPALHFIYKNYHLYVRVDSPSYLSVEYFHHLPYYQKVDQTYIQISRELGDELEGIYHYSNIQIFVLWENPYDWDRDEQLISTALLYVRLMTVDVENEEPIIGTPIHWKALRRLKNPLDMMLRVKTQRSVVVSGRVRPPDPTSVRSLALSVLVYRVTPPQDSGRGTIYVRLLQVSPSVTLMVALTLNVRPDYKYMLNHAYLMEEGSRISLDYTLDSKNSFLYLGLLPSNLANPKETDYTLDIYVARCLVRIKSMWVTEKCKVGPNTTLDQVHCKCRYTQMVGASIENPEIDMADIYDVLFFRQTQTNYLPVFFVLVFLILFGILFFFSYKKDKKSHLKDHVIVLEDNFPGEPCAYILGVYTGTQRGSGTTSNVGVKLVGTKGESRAHILRSSERKTLTTYSDDWFLLFTPYRLGNVTAINLWLDYTGKSPTWYCRKVVLYDCRAGIKYLFVVGTWLHVTTDGHAHLEAEVAPQPPSLLRPPLWPLLVDNLAFGFQELHHVKAITNHHPRSFLSQVEFVAVAFTSISSLAFFLITYYKHDNDGTEDYAYYHLEPFDFVVAFLAHIPALVVSTISIHLFRNQVVTKHISTWKMVSKAIQSLEETLAPHLKEDGSRQTELGSGECKVEEGKPGKPAKPPLPKDEHNVTFMQTMRALRNVYGAKQLPVTIAHESVDQVFIDPHRMRIAWVLVGSVLCVTCLATVLMGLTMGPIKSQIWLTVCIISIVLAATVTSSLKIILQMLVVTVFIKRQNDEPRFACDPRLGMRPELVGDTDHLAGLLERRSRPEYHPVGPHKQMKIQARLARRTCWRTFGNIFVAMVLYTLVTLNMFNSWPHCDFRSSEHLIGLIENSAYQPSISLRNLENIGDLNEYLKNALSYTYCRRTWYNGMPLSPPGDKFQLSGWLENFSFRLFGVIQLRLKRSIDVKDCLSDKLAKVFPYWRVCSPPLSSATEDKLNYTLGWSAEDGDEHKEFTSQWRYTPSGGQPSLIQYGLRDHYYSSGGYFLHLARDLEHSQTILWKMEEAGWINSMAKVLFINMCVYNPNIDMLSIVTVCLEIRETHGIETSIQVLNMRTQNMQLSWSALPWLFIIPFILWLAARFVSSLLKNGLSHLLSFWNLLDFVVIFMILFNFALGVKNVLVTKYSLQNYLETGREGFFAYGWADYHHAPYKSSYVVLVVLVTVKLFQHCAVTLRVAPIFLTFRLAGPHVLGVLAVTLPLLYVQSSIVESLLFNDRFTTDSSPLVNKVGLKNYASGFLFPDDRLVPFFFCFSCCVVIFMLTVILAHHYQMAHHSGRRITDQVDLVEAVRASFKTPQRLRAGADGISFDDTLTSVNAKLDKIIDSVSCLEQHWI